jgi:transposase-like protein
MAAYVNCPECGSDNVEKVGFTWWGGVIGPAMLTHVRCMDCRTAFNGKTGQSNTTGIVIYSLIVGMIGVR